MSKFTELMTDSGKSLIEKRAENTANTLKAIFDELKGDLEKKIRDLDIEVAKLEDLSVKNTQTLEVGKDVDFKEWAIRRIDIELEKRDLNIELETIKTLIKEYFD